MATYSAEQVILKLEDVFGSGNQSLVNYLPRNDIDDVFIDLLDEKKSLVVYGDPQSGKTLLINKNMASNLFIRVFCSQRMSLVELYEEILKSAGCLFNSEFVEKTDTKASAGSSFKATSAPFEFGIEAAKETATGYERKISPLNPNFENHNDVIRALQDSKFDKYIVLEEIHLLDSAVLTAFVSDLKSFIESGIRFVLSGVGNIPALLECGNYNVFNYLTCIPVSPWSKDSLQGYISLSEECLNVKFTDVFTNNLIDLCAGDLSLVKMVCREACMHKGIDQTQQSTVTIGDDLDVSELIRSVIGVLLPSNAEICLKVIDGLLPGKSEIYPVFMSQFAKGLSSISVYQYYKWILYCVITATPDELKNGITLDTIKEKIKATHPLKPPRPDRVRTFLTKIEKLQQEKCMEHIILEFNSDTKTLHIVDRDFTLWLSAQKKNDLLSLIGLPAD